MSAPPPPQPVYILRGHSSQIHALAFTLGNTHLLSGDASGFVILWHLASRRPVAVWRAHEGSVLKVESNAIDPRYWILTHGRDNSLHAWTFPTSALSTNLPCAPTDPPRSKPRLIASLGVNTMNFCPFTATHTASSDGMLIGVPAVIDSEAIDIMELPSGRRAHTRVRPETDGPKTGMAMALALRWGERGELELAAGYESGHCALLRLKTEGWETVYLSKPHSQPVLSLAMYTPQGWFVSTSADSLLVLHSPGTQEETRILDTNHLGQQGVAVRDDGKLVATAGWDGRLRVYKVGGKGMKEVAVLKWHREGAYAAAFGGVKILANEEDEEESSVTGSGVLGVVRQVGESRLLRGRDGREAQRHWVVGGAKDGRVSLWEVF
ncbi:WD40-repeat-containing domain protein [Geopyxis carbonaria]|nr:WD40-repeat-containing domain protein [Geopyxis carbonaria]